jgi:putative ABC transport system permease protein
VPGSLTYAVRGLAKHPGLVFVALLTLTLGIGATTAIFSVVDATLLRPLPYPDADRLLLLGDNANTGKRGTAWSWLNSRDVAADARTLSGAATYQADGYTLTGRGAAKRLRGLTVSADLFRIVGVQPILGRGFSPGEDEPGKNRIAVIGHTFWKTELEGDRDVIGKSITIDGAPHQIVGVMPPGFRFPVGGKEIEVYAPFPHSALDVGLRETRGARYLNVVGRLADGASLPRANAELATISRRLSAAYPEDNAKVAFNALYLQDWAVKDVRAAMWILLGAVGFVLLIACTNVANLLLARATARRREIAVRLALGATRGRMVWDILVENLLLSLVGCALGIVVALWGVDWLRGIAGTNLTREVTIDARVLLFAVGLAVVTGIAFGLIPARAAIKAHAGEALGAAMARGGQRSRLRSVLVTVEIGAAMLLLVGAGLLLRSFWKLTAVDPGFNPKQLIVGNVNLPEAKFSQDENAVAFYRRVLSELERVPGTKSAVSLGLPVVAGTPGVSFDIVGGAAADRHTSFRMVSPGWFDVMGIRLIRGRLATRDDDDPKRPAVALVSEAFVRTFFPDEDPIGKKIALGLNEHAPREIIGVVRDVRDLGLTADPQPMTYILYAQIPWPGFSVVMRSATPAANALRAAVSAADPDVAVEIQSMDELWGKTRNDTTLILLLLFAGVALILAVVGVYGVVSYGVAQRAQELAVRAALGAQPRQLAGLVVRQGLWLALAGVLLGAALALAASGAIAGLLYGVAAFDPLTFGAMAALLVAVAGGASFFPARRAARLDPMAVLRRE